MDIVLPFSSPEALDPALTGGKGANLARLTKHGLPVPEGFVLTARAYERFAAEAGPVLLGISGFTLQDPAALDKQCAALQQDLARIAVPSEIRAALDAGLALFPAETAFSVRSSATTEDLGGAAFAGQHETYLNCRGLGDIVTRVRDCWLSLWSARAVIYRHQAGFDIARTSMAVVVQRMVFCDVAGVGFSLNPVSGRLQEQVIDANHGLGESVVSGEAPIDHFVLDKTNGQVLSQSIAAKSCKIVASDNGGVMEVPLTGPERSSPCLDPGQLAALSALLRQVEQVYGYPQDIEWGFAHGGLWLLQSRPITRIAPRWTRDESAERFPNVITPLAWALVEEGFHLSLNYSFALMNMPPFRDKWFAMFDHYIYGNQNAVEIYADGAASHLRFDSLPALLSALPNLRRQYGWVQELPMIWTRDLDHYLMGIGELMAEPLDQKSIAELWDYVLRVKDLGAEYFLPNIAISITQRTLYRILLAILDATIGTERASAAFDQLLAYCETKTGVINKELYRLAGRIEELPPLAEAVRQQGSRDFLAGPGFGPWPDIAQTFKKFLRDHGHREVEFDPYHPTWAEAPWLVVDNLKMMLDSRHEDPADKERELKIVMRRTEEALIGRLPEDLRFVVAEIIRLSRVYTTLDDVEHYQTTRLTLPFRRGLRALGVRLVSSGVIDEPMDVFFAQYPMLDAAIRANTPEQWTALGAAIREEKTAYERHRRASPAFRLDQHETASDHHGPSLTGLPGSPGSARGQVYKVFGSEDFATFPQGAILVARTTNPAWTPLFYRAAAVITESGGPLSHGAVTAREIGLPAVMSVRDALTRLENGQTVVVDGSAGRVVAAEGEAAPPTWIST
ncbi:MAG: hypothetical protein BWK76_22160 [Desulfobulbaceae bacterium A2]|nr:MAG: hypothetical protein BWK76_22160 [Desulfobulbaceae bacterium A2]